MTLILGMSKPEGIYLSTDYRVTDAKSGKLLDDASVKFLTVRYPPDNGGPTALLAYTGLARLRDGTPTGAWIRETLRGESEFFDTSMAHLRTRLDRDIAPLGVGLIVNAFVLHGERRYIGAVSNLRLDAGQKKIVTEETFGYVMKEAHKPFFFGNGSGSEHVLAGDDLKLLHSQLDVAPRRPHDHMKLLATINRRVAARERTVSPFCHVAFVNADGRNSPQLEVFVDKGEAVPFEMPVLLFGIDLSGLARLGNERAKAAFRGKPIQDDFDAEAINEELKCRP